MLKSRVEIERARGQKGECKAMTLRNKAAGRKNYNKSMLPVLARRVIAVNDPAVARCRSKSDEKRMGKSTNKQGQRVPHRTRLQYLHTSPTTLVPPRE